MSYLPSAEILQKYADVLIKFALWSWEWCKPGDVVLLEVPESAKAIIEPLFKSVLSAGGYPVLNFIPECVMKTFYDNANQEQLEYTAKNRALGTVQDATHRVRIIAEQDVHELDDVPSDKLMTRVKASRYIMEALFEKEGKWELTWTLGLFDSSRMLFGWGRSCGGAKESIRNTQWNYRKT
jgi:aminopeptidase